MIDYQRNMIAVNHLHSLHVTLIIFMKLKMKVIQFLSYLYEVFIFVIRSILK